MMPSNGAQLLIGACTAVCIGAVCLMMMVWARLEFGCLAGLLIALATGGTVSCFSAAVNAAWSGAFAAVLSLAIFILGCFLSLSIERDDLLDRIHSDESLIRGLAESIMWREALQHDGVMLGGAIDRNGHEIQEEIPAVIVRRAEEQWESMSESEREGVRATRRKMVAESHGESLQGYSGQFRWSDQISAGCLCGALAFLVGSRRLLNGEA